MAERLPASVQYSTSISVGSLDELYQAALVFSGDVLDDALRQADSSARLLLGLTIDELLFSWSGNEFAVFGMEGRPHPVYAIQVADERKRQEVFNRAFRSIFLSEDVRLDLDGTRIPRIATPEFLQSLLRRWDIFLPSPYYIVHRDFILVSESADTLLSALRAMQRNDVLPRTADWRNIAGGQSSASGFSLYYSLDLSIPFFLRQNTTLSGFLSLYRQGLVRMGFDRGIVDLSLSLVPGWGSGVMLVGGYPLDIGMPSNRVYGAGRGTNSRIFFASGSSAFSVDLTDNSIYELSGQEAHWIIPADGVGGRDAVNAWVVSDRGRVTLVNGNMEPAQGFPVLTGLRMSSPPQAFEGRLYLCDEDGKVHTVDENGNLDVWETSFIAAVRSPPSFLTIPSRGRNRGGSFAAVYPKSFFGEIWLLDTDGRALPNWPAPLSVADDDFNTGIGFGSPLLFAHNNRLYIAFVNQTGELLIYDENASLVPPFPLRLEGVFYIQPVFDGEYLWLVSSDGILFRINLAGEVLYQRIHNFSVMEEGYITVFDYNGDRSPEVFITGEGNALFAFTRHFRSLEGFPLPVWGRPHFIEGQDALNSGRKAEIFGMGMDQRLYRWQFR
jgi:outer membrane protein assembly factor BamB